MPDPEPDRDTVMEMEAESRRDEAVNSLAELIHDEMCNDTPGCARRDRHEQYYRERAIAIIGRLEPEIGMANVFVAVRAIIDELW